MKKFKGAILLAMLIAVTAVSCKKDDSNNNATGVAATVEAANYGFDGTGGAAFKSTTAGIVKVGNILTISAIKDGGSKESISIILNNVTGVGTFDLLQDNAEGHGAIITKDYSKPSDGALNYSTDNASSTSVKGGGQVKITALTATSAEGTFYIVAHNSAGKDAFAENGTFKGKIN